MARLPFKYYLHDNASGEERAETITAQTGWTFSYRDIETMGRPFYEVTLDCVYDTETGQVTILGVGE